MTEYDPALVERMVAHLRDCASVHNIRPKDPDAKRRYDEMKAIVAELPAPVDPDLLLAREVAGRFLNGTYNLADLGQVALAAIKRVRAEQQEAR